MSQPSCFRNCSLFFPLSSKPILILLLHPMSSYFNILNLCIMCPFKNVLVCLFLPFKWHHVKKHNSAYYFLPIFDAFTHITPCIGSNLYTVIYSVNQTHFSYPLILLMMNATLIIHCHHK